MLHCHIYHHQVEFLCPVLNTRYYYEVVNNGFYTSYAVNYKRFNCEYIGVTKHKVVKFIDVAP